MIFPNASAIIRDICGKKQSKLSADGMFGLSSWYFVVGSW
jgi:hypothetical protein